ncbi:hypothetical protein ASG50_18650 [Rhizobium sp. Leaf386]|nr:hypothetical protein ASG50_18650 [Rhizobium sp. Leaf386]
MLLLNWPLQRGREQPQPHGLLDRILGYAAKSQIVAEMAALAPHSVPQEESNRVRLLEQEKQAYGNTASEMIYA